MKLPRQEKDGHYNYPIEIGADLEETQVLNLQDVVRQMAEELRALLRENIRLEYGRPSERESAPVKAVRGEIEDLLRHLTLDARDAMPEGGSILIQTGTVAFGAEHRGTHPEIPPGVYALLTIRDTGDGSNATARNGWLKKGRSLGLNACFNAIEKYDGHLCVSRRAHETHVSIYFPRALPSPPLQ